MDQWSRAITEALAAIRPVVVHVTAVDQKGVTTVGTGVVLDNYHVLTSGQIAAREDACTIRTFEGKKFEADCIAVDPLYFIAVLRVKHRLPVDPPRITPRSEIQVGRTVLAVGYALGLELTASQGIVTATDHTVYRPERFPVDGLVVTDASIHPGNTGGPLIDLEGRILGLNGVQWMNGLSLAVRFDVAARIANQVIEYGAATHPWLGFFGQPEVVDPTLVSLLELPADRGVVVQYLDQSGPGARAGLEVMDMVVRVAGEPAVHVGQIRQVLATRRPGEKVPLTVLRGGNLIDLEIEVEEIPRLRKK
ncbi:MAG: S1C family serine protease [Firmicutes bacterium]|nr:S1C family serine protease [Bacillota bacterium]